ncbi:hypothetical protein FRAHR75_430066 [Frankia sp. Hr75.2]|nr:hypothetical protein FRAHR75_430066 [Frankia sp. Hr75.2]
MGEPHWHTSHAEALLGRGAFERVLASVHSAPAAGGGFTEVSARLIERFDAFEILAHIDYPVRYWPADAQPYDPYDCTARCWPGGARRAARPSSSPVLFLFVGFGDCL